MDDATLAHIDELIHRPHGIVLVTGPTGSGKTTTLYAALSRLDAKTLNIMTVEDPIEYDLDGISQTQVNPRIEMSFRARAAHHPAPGPGRHHDRRNPRPGDRADRGAGRLTGHLVLATLHTNDAVSAVTRLVDMGVEPFLLASSLIGVLGQRLVRRLCPECRQPHAASDKELAALGLPPAGRAVVSARWAARAATTPAIAAAPASTNCSRSTSRCAA